MISLDRAASDIVAILELDDDDLGRVGLLFEDANE